MKPKIGIFALPFSSNYGGILLAYAVQKVCLDMGKDAIVLRYQKTQTRTLQRIKIRTQDSRCGARGVIYKIYRQISRDIVNMLSLDVINQIWQKRKCESFRRSFMRITNQLSTVRDIEKELSTYNLVLIGGDQIWNVCGQESVMVYFLNLNLIEGIRKVSYGPCFGRSEVPAAYEKLIGDSLLQFDFIGVRNKMSQEVVKRLSGRDAKLVVDPTLLISFDEVTAKTDLGTNMMVFYCIKTSQLCMAKIRRVIKKSLGCKVLSISLDRPFLFADQRAWGVGPSEWLAIFKNAEYIITDSFHGTIFAIKNCKQFISIVNPKDRTGGRIIDLLERYSLKERLVSSPEQVSGELMQRPIDYDRVHEEIARDVHNSYEYLKKALALVERSGE